MDSHRGPNDWLAAYSLGSKEKEMLANLVELACEVTDAVQYRTNNGALKDKGLHRKRTAASFWQISLDLADATVILTKNQLPQSAISLARPLLESYLRGSWLLRCSTPEHFQNIVEHRQPGPKISKIKRDLIKGDLIKCGDTDKSWIGQWTDSDIMCVLHDFAHVGALAAEQRSVGDAIAPSFPREMMTELMELGIGVRLRAGRDLLMLMGDSVGVAEMVDLLSCFKTGSLSGFSAAIRGDGVDRKLATPSPKGNTGK